MTTKKILKLHTLPDTYYVWVGGSCDYANEERAGGAASITEKENKRVEIFVVSELHTTEFRILLKVMLHAMEVIPENSKICFLTNVAYLQNFDKEPTPETANQDLIRECIELQKRHSSCFVKIVPYHKYAELLETHDLAHDAMIVRRTGSRSHTETDQG